MQRIYNQVLYPALLQKVLILNFTASLFFFFSVIGSIIRKKKDLSFSVGFDEESNGSPTGNS